MGELPRDLSPLGSHGDKLTPVSRTYLPIWQAQLEEPAVRSGARAQRTKAQHRMRGYYEIAGQEAPPEEREMDLLLPPAQDIGNNVVDFENAGARIVEHARRGFAVGDAPVVLVGDAAHFARRREALKGMARPTHRFPPQSAVGVCDLDRRQDLACHPDTVASTGAGEAASLLVGRHARQS